MTETKHSGDWDNCESGDSRAEHTILIVDDSPLNLDVAMACLEGKGYRVVAVENGVEALEIVETLHPSLILLDIMMPEMSGFETCRRLKKIDTVRDIPVVFMTALTDVKSKKEGFEAGGVDYVTKPFQTEELAARVHTHISLQTAYRDLKDSEQRYRRLMETTPDAILVQDDSGIVYLNTATVKLFGVQENQQLLGASLLDFVARDNQEIVEQQLRHVCQDDQSQAVPLIVELFRADDSEMDVELRCIPISYHGATSRMFVLRDVTEKRRQEAIIEFQATHDPLTGLPNRSLFYGRVTQAINHAQRSGEKLAIMFIDLDKFKLINDTLGHNAGDELLRIMSARLKECTRDCDTLARIGGDEFVLLVDQAGSEAALTHLASRLIEAVSVPVSLLGYTHAISCSVGISTYPDDGDTVELLLKRADIAMYRAKDAGRNAFQFFTYQMQDRLNERLKLEICIKQALEKKEFYLHYQPQVDLRTGKIMGLEALIRWESAELGFVEPSEFIPAAEDSRQIIKIGEWVLRTVCSDLKSWKEQGISLVPVAINISALQFTGQNFVRLIKDVISQYDVDAKYLELELTETLSMSDPEASVALMRRLRGIGVSMAIDDFGTGYSNLSYLKRFPVNKLKIDRAFVSGLTNSPDDHSIVMAIIRMAQGLGLKTIAEGVETAGQLSLLAEQCCDAIQGYYFSRPISLKDITAMLKAGGRLDLTEVGRSPEKNTLLVIDDEPNVLVSIKRTLRGEPYEILTAEKTTEAYEILARHEVGVVLSDLKMPNESGVEFFSKIKMMYPQTVRILLTGYGTIDSLENAINQGEIYRYMAKPWDSNQLTEVISSAFTQYEKNSRTDWTQEQVSEYPISVAQE
ncbi:signal transduction protein [Hahella sp. CCB-MM4]|uniref:EAL domain-containing protein n=1 Tax=Hahella sp. (strain CCB-MM4) TaxID=1926491 RepID=UPI000B9BD713|nr:EAL domain-containing protein [Hahella sp. CCB-MM4]OZG70714.1 signal transduction protein [Hahella sp. CCB-MM4]